MAKDKPPKGEGKDDSTSVATPANATAEAAAATPIKDVTVPVEAGAATEVVATDGTKAKPVKDGIPEHLKKGNRVCAACSTPEADFLAKNPRYSLCQGVDVLCYRKGHRVIHGMTIEQVNAKYPDKVGKNDDKGLPLIQEVSGMGIKPGILVRGAITYSRKATDTAGKASTPTPAETASTATPVSTAAAESGAGSASTTSAG